MKQSIETVNTSLTTYQAVDQNLFDRYARFLQAKPRTVQTYTHALKQFYTWMKEHNISQPVREDIIAWENELINSRSASTVNSYVIAVRLFFRWTDQEGLYPNIADHIKGVQISKDPKKDYLTSRQVKKVLKSIDQESLKGKRDYAMICLMVTCGLRDIEVSRANIGDLRTRNDQTVLYIQGKGKSEKQDYVIIPEQTEDAIRTYLTARNASDQDEPLFTSTSNNSNGKGMTTRSISKVVKTRLQEAGFDSERLTAHSLRHTAVTLALINGMDVQTVQQFARHSNINTTMIYAHNLDKDRNRCSNTVATAIF